MNQAIEGGIRMGRFALTTYGELAGYSHGGDFSEESLVEALADLLCDLRHVAQSHHLDWEALLADSDLQYLADITGVAHA